MDNRTPMVFGFQKGPLMIAATQATATKHGEAEKEPSADEHEVTNSRVTVDAGPQPEDKPRRRSTSHLKLVPETLELREKIREAAEAYVIPLDKSRPFNKTALESHGRKLLEQMGQPEGFLGFAMVLI